MDASLSQCPPDVADILGAIADSVVSCGDALRWHCSPAAAMHGSTSNPFGDHQIDLDVQMDDIIFERLRRCASCSHACSEERPEMISMSSNVDESSAAAEATWPGLDQEQLQGGATPESSSCRPRHGPRGDYVVAFDPLDGSSIVGANFAIGSIFGVWKGAILGATGRDQVCAAYALYGPQTLLVWARPRGLKGEGSTDLIVEEFVWLEGGGGWALRRSEVTIGREARTFAPANLRAASTNKSYKRLVDSFIDRGLTLRYSGGMVPDLHHILHKTLHHILQKGEGLFVSPSGVAPSAPAKLRLVYECAPLAFIFEAAGARSIGDDGASVLDQKIMSLEQRSRISIGSADAVEETKYSMIDC